MRRVIRWMAAALLLAGAALVGCKSLPPAEATRAAMDETRALIRQAVQDDDRAGDMLTLVDQLEVDLDAYSKRLPDHNRALAKANADYAVSRTEMQALYDAFNTDVRGMLQKVSVTLMALKALATPDEWSAISQHKHRVGGFQK